MLRNKIIYDGNILIDLTEDTVTPETLLEGVTAHDASGNLIIGTLREITISEIDAIINGEGVA